MHWHRCRCWKLTNTHLDKAADFGTYLSHPYEQHYRRISLNENSTKLNRISGKYAGVQTIFFAQLDGKFSTDLFSVQHSHQPSFSFDDDDWWRMMTKQLSVQRVHGRGCQKGAKKEVARRRFVRDRIENMYTHVQITTLKCDSNCSKRWELHARCF